MSTDEFDISFGMKMLNLTSPISINILKNPDIVEPKSFYVKYAGLVPEIRKDIDPCGRTDLLKILDEAETEGHITIVGSKNDFIDDAMLIIDCDGIKMTSIVNKEKLLIVPLHMLASVGFVKEEALNIVALRIGEIDQNADIYDLALIYTKTSKIAEEICAHLNKCFHYVYHEAIMWDDDDDIKSKYGTINSHDSSSISPQHGDSHSIRSVPGICLTETSTESSSKSIPDVNEYIAMLSASLNTEEQKRLCDLMSRWRKGDIKILEFGQKLLELYGPERKHLLARMRHLLRQISREDLEALNKFLQVNGITENAASATSPLLTGEMSLTTEGSSPVLDNISACSDTWSSFGGRRYLNGRYNS
uniref:Cerebral cavernous malformations 2 harmonin-homology domain-containing protein n=1 Tax=Acrobeloides nanus TaxID=290746 RepID=A0A914E8K8_9BILA